MEKQKMPLCQSDSGEQRDVCHRHRLEKATFKRAVSENVSLSALLLRLRQPLLPVVLGCSSRSSRGSGGRRQSSAARLTTVE